MSTLRYALCLASAVALVACGAVEDDPTLVNASPNVVAANANQDAMAGFEFTYDATQADATFSDPDGDALTYAVTITPDGSGLTATDGVVTGTPSTTEPITVTVTATDSVGNAVSDSFMVNVAVDQDAVLAAFDGRIDLTQLESYENPFVPEYITKFDNSNPVTDAGATLGRVLFYDVNLSIDNTISCASCHQQARGFSDFEDYSFGVDGGETDRHSMRLINVAYAEELNMFWNKRADSVEAQATEPLRAHAEHGFSGESGRPDFDDLVAKLQGIDYYQELFRFVFHDEDITEERLQIALGQFVRSIVSFDSKWDEGRAQVNSHLDAFPNFTGGENAGKTLFNLRPSEGGAGCAECHRPPEFDIDPQSGHNGVVTVINRDDIFDFGNTRAPSLRDLFRGNPRTSNGPFMHDGQFIDLRAVIDHYDDIAAPGKADPATFMAGLDPRLQTGGVPQSLGLTDDEKDDLIAYLRTLGGDAIYTDEKWSSPFQG